MDRVAKAKHISLRVLLGIALICSPNGHILQSHLNGIVTDQLLGPCHDLLGRRFDPSNSRSTYQDNDPFSPRLDEPCHAQDAKVWLRLIRPCHDMEQSRGVFHKMGQISFDVQVYGKTAAR